MVVGSTNELQASTSNDSETRQTAGTRNSYTTMQLN